MRKVLCLLSVILVLVACAVPAFAMGYNYRDRYFSCLPFDFIHLDSGASLEWIMKEGSDGSEVKAEYVGDPYEIERQKAMTAVMNCTDTYMEALVTIPYTTNPAYSTQTVTFTARDMAIRPMALQNYKIESMDTNVGLNRIIFYGTFFYPVWTSDNKVEMQLESFEYVWHASTEDGAHLAINVNLGYLLFECLQREERFTPALMLLHELTIDIDVNYTDKTMSEFTLRTYELFDNYSSNPVRARTWFNYVAKDIIGERVVNETVVEPPTLEDLDLGKWLTNTVGAFLDFEIVPGFSFTSLFYAVIVIGFVLWFIKIIS